MLTQIKKAKAIVDMIDDGRSQTVSDALLRQVLIILERIEKQEMLARLGLSDDDDPLSRQAKARAMETMETLEAIFILTISVTLFSLL